MPFWRTYYHLVWTTRNREPLITPQVEAGLYAYMLRKAGELGVFVYAVNGCSDHVHMIVAIPPHVCVAELVKLVKGASSHELNQRRPDLHFAWQRGYGVVTLGQRQRADAEAYVRRQKEHHAQTMAVAWLEYVTEGDEGPRDVGSTETRQPEPSVREEQAPYGAHGEPMF